MFTILISHSPSIHVFRVILKIMTEYFPSSMSCLLFVMKIHGISREDFRGHRIQ
jgi:hypothetical protein